MEVVQKAPAKSQRSFEPNMSTVIEDEETQWS